MNFDNQGIVFGTLVRQGWVLLLVYRPVYITDAYFKTHFITMEYTTPLKNIEIIRKYMFERFMKLKATKLLD